MIASTLLVSLLLAAPTAPDKLPSSYKPPQAPAAAQPTKDAAAQPAKAPAAAAKAPQAPIVIETKRGKLEFSHKVHAKTACAQCHKGAEAPGKIGIKGKEAAHKFCVDCHKAEKKGPQKCGACHEMGGKKP